jgi:hypothetical protein
MEPSAPGISECKAEGRMDNFGFAKVLRARAEEFRSLAQAIAEEHTRKSFLGLARSYDELAEAEDEVHLRALSVRDPTSRP